MTGVRRKSIDLDGRIFSYLDEGAGEPLLLLHAFPLNANMWEPQIQKLRHEWRCIAPDLRGFGKSQLMTARASNRDPEPAISMDDYADDLIRLLTELGLGQITILGLSMGGYVAFALWRQNPALFRGLVLCDTRAGADSDEARANRLEMIQLVKEGGARAAARQMMPNLLSAGAWQSRPELISQVESLISAAPSASVVAGLHALMNRPDSTPLLPEITCPTAVIVGAQDSLTNVEQSREMMADIPEARLMVLPNAGHLSNLEQPELFSAAVGAFLNGVAARCGADAVH